VLELPSMDPYRQPAPCECVACAIGVREFCKQRLDALPFNFALPDLHLGGPGPLPAIAIPGVPEIDLRFDRISLGERSEDFTGGRGRDPRGTDADGVDDGDGDGAEHDGAPVDLTLLGRDE